MKNVKCKVFKDLNWDSFKREETLNNFMTGKDIYHIQVVACGHNSNDHYVYIFYIEK